MALNTNISKATAKGMVDLLVDSRRDPWERIR